MALDHAALESFLHAAEPTPASASVTGTAGGGDRRSSIRALDLAAPDLHLLRGALPPSLTPRMAGALPSLTHPNAGVLAAPHSAFDPHSIPQRRSKVWQCSTPWDSQDRGVFSRVYVLEFVRGFVGWFLKMFLSGSDF